ncbi:AraC family transcriptional regulator [Roseivirga sp.]|uniref:AraC family transcriptional regulator n=1 Tax=Roseivirga sp. TaxID=1964215 RepID=UPI003B8D8E90
MASSEQKQDIPQIQFDSGTNNTLGLEIVPIEKIAKHKNHYNHNPESPHQLSFYNLIFFTEGKGRHFIDFEWHPVQQNSLLYLAKDQINAFDFSENLQGFCIIFTEEYFINCFANLPEDFVFRLFTPQLFCPVVQIPATSDFNDYFIALKKEVEVKGSFIQPTITAALFTVLVSKAEEVVHNHTSHLKNSSQIKFLHQFNSLIETNFSKSRSAQFYAKEMAVTYKHLNEVCTTVLGRTAKTIIDDFVILQAKRNLINSTIKSTELAYKIGFKDPTNFTKYFKKSTGFTPKEFSKSFI